jgi:hypothetical protein
MVQSPLRDYSLVTVRLRPSLSRPDTPPCPGEGDGCRITDVLKTSENRPFIPFLSSTAYNPQGTGALMKGAHDGHD